MATTGGRAVNNQRAGGDLASGYNSVDTGQRESLSNFISMITRDETPFISSIGKTKTNAIYHEWQTDELSAPGLNRLGEGEDYVDIAMGQTNDALAAINGYGTNRTRLGNYCQISGKTLEISNTRRAIDVAGVADEYAYQLKKKGTELRRDQEYAMINGFQTASAGTGSAGSYTRTANAEEGVPNTIRSERYNTRIAAGPQAFFNDARTCVYASGNAVGDTADIAVTGRGNAEPGTGTWAPVLEAVTDRALLALSHIDDAMQKLYEEGGKANKLMVSPSLRRDFSNLVQGEQSVRRNLDEKGKLRQSVDVYMSDFGDVMVVPNYIMGLRTTAAGTGATEYKDSWAFLYDPQWMKMVQLRPLHEVDIRPQGDSTKGMMIEEWSFEVTNPRGCSAIYGLKSGASRVGSATFGTADSDLGVGATSYDETPYGGVAYDNGN